MGYMMVFLKKKEIIQDIIEFYSFRVGYNGVFEVLVDVRKVEFFFCDY